MKKKPDNFLLIEQEKEEVDRDNRECENYHRRKDDEA